MRARFFALLIAFVESLLVLFSDHGWWIVVLAAAAAVLAHWFLGRRWHGITYEVTWIAAASQLLAVLVPVLWVVVKRLNKLADSMAEPDNSKISVT